MSRRSVMGLVALALTSSVTCLLTLPMCDVKHNSKFSDFSDLVQGRLGKKVNLYSTAYTMTLPGVDGVLTELTQISGDRWQVAHAVQYSTGSCQQVFKGTFIFNQLQRRLESVPQDLRNETLFIYRLAGDLENGLLLYIRRERPKERAALHVMTSKVGLTPDVEQFRDVLTAVCGDFYQDDRFFNALKVKASQTVKCPPMA